MPPVQGVQGVQGVSFVKGHTHNWLKGRAAAYTAAAYLRCILEQHAAVGERRGGSVRCPANLNEKQHLWSAGRCDGVLNRVVCAAACW